MNKKLLSLIVLFLVVKANAQSFMGYIPDNYAGVQGVLFNPASIVDSRFKTDVNVFSFSASLSNDYYGMDVLKPDGDGVRTPTPGNSGIVNLDVMLPSFMFNIAPKHSVAIFTRARAVVNTNEMNGYLYDQFKDGLDEASDFNINVGSPKAIGHQWMEIGGSYAAVLWQNKQHFLKGGLTAKYLTGGIVSYASGTDITSEYNQTGDPENSYLTTTGTLAVASSQDVVTGDEDYKIFDSNATGFGADLGLIYEWRPDYESYDLSKAKPADNNFRDLNKYKLRLGVSVTDLGSIKYSKLKEDVYNIDGEVSAQDIEDAENMDDFLEDHYTLTTTNDKSITVSLPTMVRFDVDWNIYKKFYLNANGNLGLNDKSDVSKTYSQDVWIFTPRYETRWFTFSVPVNHMEYSGTQVGAALRFGPIFIGSSSAITNVFTKDSKAADVYFGIKIPVYEKKFKDTDEDGILEKEDSCPTEAGPFENKGCPWPDTDKDSVLDKDDKCPSVAGPVENAGCPWGDADKDTVLDNVDTCPSVAGPVENAGCPWPDTDGDTVLDKDDKCPTDIGLVENAGCPDADKDGITDKEDNCPTVPGPVNNIGCPEITEAALQELKVQARSVFFVTGKAVLENKGQTDERLDAIKEILVKYPNAKFSIEGHTDNVGNLKANQKLSEERAKVVMDALVAKGVNPANLTYKGFGASKPVASNKTAKGRAENRRTEVIHVGTIYEGKL